MSVLSNNEDNIMVKCSCHAHALEIMYDDWDKSTIPLIYMSIWTYGQRPFPLSWKDRLRWTWYLLTNGRLHGDDIVIDENDALVIARFLTEKIKMIDTRKKEMNYEESKKVKV